jgi:ATP-binding cassette subfamily F protein uup
MNGKERHIIGYLKGFLFTPKRSMMPVKSLSGGERNRIILAKLFTKAANLLILDEPTNDLDMETLEVLEQRLTEYNGTLIVVSHDRQFLDNVVTSTIVFEADGKLKEYVGGYSDWLRQGRELAEADNPVENEPGGGKQSAAQAARQPKKLTYNEQRELDQLPENIQELEKRATSLEVRVSAADFYAQGHEVTKPILQDFSQTQRLLDQALERWTELEDRQQQYKLKRP